jgi:hypothetical protein
MTQRKEKHYSIEAIVDRKTLHGRPLYLVSWVGYKRRTWEPRDNFCDPSSVDEFEELYEAAKTMMAISRHNQTTHHLKKNTWVRV